MRKILITGVAGFIGSNLAEKLLKEGDKVIGIDNFSYGNKRNLSKISHNKNFEFVYGDLTNPLLLKDIKAEQIIHLASQKIPRYTNALRTLEENNLMLKNVIQKCINDKIKIIFASTSDVYGKSTNLPFKEDNDLLLGNTKIKRWAYALSKIYGEQYIIANNDQYEMNYTIVRFFGSYGTNQNLTWWGGPQSLFISKAFNNEEIEIHGDGKQTRTFTFIEDTVEAIYQCVINSSSDKEIFNIASNPKEEISIFNLSETIWKLINGVDSEVKVKFIPYSTFGRYEDVRRRVPDISKIKKFFNFEPKYSLKEGLIKTIEWQKSIMGI